MRHRLPVPSGRLRRAQPARLWSLDLETTGLDHRHARMLAVGMVPVEDRVIRVGQAFSTLVHPGDDAVERRRVLAGAPAGTGLTGAALAVEGIQAHHLRPADVADAPPLSAVLPAILARLDDADGLLVHHAPLDLPVLRRACRQGGRAWPDIPVIDTVRLIDRANRRAAISGAPRLPTDLAGARAALGLPPHTAHDATADAIATAELYLVLRARLTR